MKNQKNKEELTKEQLTGALASVVIVASLSVGVVALAFKNGRLAKKLADTTIALNNTNFILEDVIENGTRSFHNIRTGDAFTLTAKAIKDVKEVKG